MCGPSSTEKSLEQSQQTFASTLQQNYQTLYGNQLGVLNAINRSLSPILSAGPNQQGFSGPEVAARQTEIINNASAANRAAQQAARTYGAGQGGGGTSGVTSGITKQIESAIGSQAAQTAGSQLDTLTAENYQAGRENYWRAQGGMSALASGYSPNAAAGEATSANQSAFGEAKTIQQQSEETSQMIAGGLTSLAGSALTFGAGAMGGGGLKGGLTALASGGKTNNYGG